MHGLAVQGRDGAGTMTAVLTGRARSLANLIQWPVTHGRTRVGRIDPLHRIWRSMRQRCQNPKDKRFPRYGGRGIKVCERWQSFESFAADVEPRPPGVGPGGRSLYSLERIDNDGDYEPANVRWATAREQARNASYNRKLTFRGETLLLCEWAERLGVSSGVIRNRLVRGLSEQEALSMKRRTHCESCGLQLIRPRDDTRFCGRTCWQREHRRVRHAAGGQ